MNAMTETKPIFDVNKTYRTRCGQHVKNVRAIGNRFLRGFRVCDGADFMWHADGRVIEGRDEFSDLMPGAIEDEKPEAKRTYHFYDPQMRMQELERRINVQNVTIAGMLVKIGEITNSLPLRNMLLRIETTEEFGRNIQSRVKIIEGFLRRFKPDPDMSTEPAPQTPYKPTIQGGWLNVYRAGSLAIDIKGRYLTKVVADEAARPDRIACIQIPDITEGEGL